MPACRYCRFVEPRRGASRDECEDAAAADPGRGRFAIADGATESSHAGPWARLLVEAFVRQEELAWPGWIVPLQGRWAQAVAPPERPLPWYLEGRLEQGAFSTFVGLSLSEEAWHAVAVGDSCLVHMRGARATAFPLEHSSQFGNSPALIGSCRPVEEIPLRQARQCMGECRPGDRLWLMTDALAAWYLSRMEAGERPWEEMQRLADQDEAAFSGWVARQRESRRLRNDDTTLLGVLL